MFFLSFFLKIIFHLMCALVIVVGDVVAAFGKLKTSKSEILVEYD